MVGTQPLAHMISTREDCPSPSRRLTPPLPVPSGAMPQVLQDLLELVSNEMEGGEGGSADPALTAYYNNTLRHIKHQRDKGGDLGRLFQQLSI